MTVAIIAVSLAVGTWFGIRWAEARHQVNDLLATVAATPLPNLDPHTVDADRWRWN